MYNVITVIHDYTSTPSLLVFVTVETHDEAKYHLMLRFDAPLSADEQISARTWIKLKLLSRLELENWNFIVLHDKKLKEEVRERFEKNEMLSLCLDNLKVYKLVAT